MAKLPAPKPPSKWDEFYRKFRKGARKMGLEERRPTLVEVFTGPNLGNNNLNPATQARETSWTWMKPEGAVMVQVTCIGGGGGGGSGRRAAAGTYRGGGWGGGAGAWVYATYPADLLPASVEVTAGLGGAGGAALLVDTKEGLPGSNGGLTTFGPYLTAAGGVLGPGGTFTATTTTPEPYRTDRDLILGAPRTPPTLNAAAAPGCQGGGGGGGYAADNSLLSSGQGTRSLVFANGSSAALAPGQSGLDYEGLLVGPGNSGAGGVEGAVNGGNGGRFGAGAGGGAGTTNGTDSGAGGRGGDGVCLIVTVF